MSKRRITRQYEAEYVQRRMRTMYFNKYYNMFMNMFEWKGLTTEEQVYVMKKLWSYGTIAAFKIKNLDILGFAPYAGFSWNMYDFPEEVTLINERGVPFIPSTPQIVDKDVVLGWAQFNQKPVQEIVEYYIDRIDRKSVV